MSNNTSELEMTSCKSGYWNWRNIFVDLLAVMIVGANSLLIYIILKSAILRKQVETK